MKSASPASSAFCACMPLQRRQAILQKCASSVREIKLVINQPASVNVACLTLAGDIIMSNAGEPPRKRVVSAHRRRAPNVCLVGCRPMRRQSRSSSSPAHREHGEKLLMSILRGAKAFSFDLRLSRETIIKNRPAGAFARRAAMRAIRRRRRGVKGNF